MKNQYTEITCILYTNEWLLLNHERLEFLAFGGEEFNPGPETRLDRSELLCNRVLLKYKIRLHCCFIIPSTEFKLSCNWLRLRNVEEKKCLSFPPPWEFQNPLSLGTPRLLINLPRKWFSHSSVSQLCPTLCNTMNCSTPPCPSPTPEVHWNACPSSRWCHPAISSSVVPFSSCP